MHSREYLPGNIYMVTRRVIGRHYLLRPDKQASQIWLYSLAVAAKQHGVTIHSFILMSTHEHVIVTDVRGVMGAFLRDFHRNVANAMKLVRDWDGIFWDGNPPSVVRLRTSQAFIEKCGYGIANPVAALAVEQSRHWPGLIVHAHQVGNKTFVVQRPEVYFDPKSWPPTSALTLSMPKLTGISDSDARIAIAHEAERLEREARDKARAERKTFMGAEKSRRVSPTKRATSYEQHGTRNPTFAVGRDNPEQYKAAALAVREFRHAYRKALLAWRNNMRDVVFPAGTYVMAWLHHVNVAAV